MAGIWTDSRLGRIGFRVLTAVLLVALLSMIAACGSSDSPSTQHVTSSPPGVSTAIQNGSIVINPLELTSQQGSAFEELLARLPANDITRGYTTLGDFDGIVQLMQIEPLSKNATPEQRKEFVEDAILTEINGFRPPVPAWPVELRDFRQSLDMFANVAFDSASVRQFANAGTQGFMSSGPPVSYDVAIGDFDLSATEMALARCGCVQPEIREYRGMTYFAWGDGSGTGDITRRLEPPLFDHLGRGPHLLVRDGEAYYSVIEGVIEQHIDVLQGNIPALIDEADYLDAIRWLNGLGTNKEITLRDRGFTVEEATDLVANPSSVRESIESSQLLTPFRMAATATGFDGERPYVGLFVAHDTPEAASLNERRLLNRLTAGEASQGISWDEIVDRVDITTDQHRLVVRLYFSNPPRIFFNLLFGNTLLVHE